MTMTSSNQVFVKGLTSHDTPIILETLEQIRHEGDCTILSHLFDLLVDTYNVEIKNAIAALLNDLKDKSSVASLVEGIRNPKYQSELAVIVSACWQCGLDFSEYLSDFVDLVLTNNYLVAIEAFTVIESTDARFADELLSANILKIKAQLCNLAPDRKPLVAELLKLLESK